MKKLMFFYIIIAFFFIPKNVQAQHYESGGLGIFYSSLAPYGSWIELGNGVTVWRPMNLRNGWAPYRYGRWIWTNDGWYWDSDEPFGYIVFHYGRWYYDDYYGWIWVPDDVWAPAWVQWRYDNDYIGWAALPPYANFSIGIGISFSTGYETPYSFWHFVSYRHMCDPYVYRYYVPDRIKYRIYSQSRFRTNYGYSDGRVINRGVDVDFVRQRSGVRITERQIQRVSDPGELRGNSGTRNSNSIRALIISRNSSDRIPSNVEIQRGNRPSSLDLSRVEIGRNIFNRGNNSSEIQRDQNFQIQENRSEPVSPNNRRFNPNINRENNRQIEREQKSGRSQNQNFFNRIFKEDNNRQKYPRNEINQNRREPQPQVRKENANNGRENLKRESNNRNDNKDSRARGR